METNNTINFVPGEAYKNFFLQHRRYKILKGSRASKKSTNVSCYILLKILGNTTSNAVCLRKYFDNLRTSVYSQLQKSAHMLGVYEKFIWKKNPLQVIKKSTGQVICFIGLKEVDTLTSFTLGQGEVDTVWLEEACEITDYLVWVKVEGSFRGTEKIEFIMTFNPWTKNWIYDYFFQGKLEDNPEILEKKGWQEYIDNKFLLLTTNHRINEFLPKDTHSGYMRLKEHTFHIYQVVSLGCWGSYEGLVYSGIKIGTHIIPRRELLENNIFDYAYLGVDYGLKVDATTAVLVGVNSATGLVAVLDEWGHSNKGLKRPKSFTEICSDVVEFAGRCQRKYHFFGSMGRAFVENQELSFQQILNSRARDKRIDVLFTECKKTAISDRIKVFRYLIGLKKFMIASECIETKREYLTCSYDLQILKETGKLIRSGEMDDYINAVEYALTDAWEIIFNSFAKIGLGDIYEEN